MSVADQPCVDPVNLRLVGGSNDEPSQALLVITLQTQDSQSNPQFCVLNFNGDGTRLGKLNTDVAGDIFRQGDFALAKGDGCVANQFLDA